MAVLIGMSAEIKGKHFPVDRDPFTIGRVKDNAVVLDHPTVSSRHCQIMRDGERFLLKDLDSTNGTMLNAKPVREARLRPKDLVQVGSVELLFDAEEPAGAADETARDAGAGLGETVRVEVATEPVGTPDSFASISPFGTRRRETKGWVLALLILLGLLAIGGVGVVVYKLFTAGP